MINLKNRKIDIDQEYYECVKDLINNSKIQEMKEYMHHGDVTCLEHCISVSIMNYKLCKFLGMDYRSCARAGILHDFFLYDWHKRKAQKFFKKHGFLHSRVSLKNAKRYFILNDIEEDMILKHMWPLNIDLPKYKETYVIIITDKIVCISEIIKSIKFLNRV